MKVIYKGKNIGSTVEMEYYDREKDYHGIGTFVVLNDLPIKPNQLFIVPKEPENKDGRPRGNGIAGCCEGREKHPAYLKPIALYCKGTSEHHIKSHNGTGSWIKYRCYIELDSLEDFETIPE